MNKKKSSILDEDNDMISALEAGGYESIEDEAAEVQRYTKIFRASESHVL